MNVSAQIDSTTGPVMNFPSYDRLERMMDRAEVVEIQMTHLVAGEPVTENFVVERWAARRINGTRQSGTYTVCPTSTASISREGARIVNISADADGSNAIWWV